MKRILAALFVLLLGCVALSSCPNRKEAGLPSDEKGEARTIGKKLKLEYKLNTNSTHQSLFHTKLNAHIVIDALDSKGKPVTTFTDNTTSTNFQREIFDGKVTGGKLERSITTIAGIMDKTQSEEGKAVRRMLILESGAFRVTDNGQKATPTPDEELLAESLAKQRRLLVDKAGKVERAGEEWGILINAQSSPVFPYIDVERLTELAHELPTESVRVGDIWSRTSELVVGGQPLSLNIVSTLKDAQEVGSNNLVHIEARMNGANAETINLSGQSGDYEVSTKVDRLALSGIFSVYFDRAKGRVQSLMGDLEISFALNTTLKEGGEVQTLRVKVDGAKVRITEDHVYELPKSP